MQDGACNRSIPTSGESLLPNQRPDDQLIAACHLGERQAAELLIERYWDQLHAYVYRLCYNAADAEDITQETFLRALHHLSKFSGSGSFRAWLIRIATNIFLDDRKSARNKDVASDFTEQVGRSQEPHMQVDVQEQVGLLYQEIKTLTREQQVALMLRMVEHFEYAEIAKILETKESTARWHVYEARRVLRLRLGHVFAAKEENGDGL